MDFGEFHFGPGSVEVVVGLGDFGKIGIVGQVRLYCVQLGRVILIFSRRSLKLLGSIIFSNNIKLC